MSPDDALKHRVAAALGRAPSLEEKRMFGGVCFMVRGKMCVTVGQSRIMCRIDPAIHDKAIQRKGCRTMVMKGRPFRGYVHVDVDVLRTKRQLDYWVGLALDYNKKLQAALKKR
jgi:TfoX/Sxy family transcriptional regulator of competence genes